MTHRADDPLDAGFMQLAVDASSDALRAGNMPFGAVLVQGGQVLQVSCNQRRTANAGEGDCTAHAEVMLIREATAAHGPEALAGGTVYASGEPCAMCSGALFWAGVSRIVYAASTPDIIAVLGGRALPVRCHEVLANASPAVRVDGPILREAAVALLRSAVERS
ncbi:MULTISPECIES: nucleoside deaminase [Sorangium]|uniref:Cytosine/adenosine deaminase n=1 Tax=Sorangium cellulosum (strain So ce56) TaxID=448385 RepID=A9EW37_SORC5|nr:nucleoside deaminase [Sorangium cellulosum]CAN94284.1 cytosine/adenosine deaminase [Sorangium cellulosum So ce56]